MLLRNTGAALSPFNAFLFLQGIETLPLRMERHRENALAVAQHLEEHPDVALGQLPGPRVERRTTRSRSASSRAATARSSTFGDRGRPRGRARRSSRRSSCSATSRTSATRKSLAIHNATTTHSQLNDEELAAAGVTQDTVRLSVGIEHIDDILADLDQALAKARPPSTPEPSRR